MATVYFITDQKNNEGDILKPLIFQDLYIYEVINNLKDHRLILEVPAPLNGWTHNQLELTNDKLLEITDKEAVLEAFLGTSWVGSSEC